MRLDVPDLTAKILRFRPRIVCLVGKKIWDEYEFVASKTAGPACVPGIASSCQNGDIKPGLESFSQVQDVDVKVEPHDEEDGVKVESVDQKQAVSIELGLASPVSPRRWTSVSSKQKRTTKASTSAKAKFDWSQPRPLRLPWSTAGGRTIHGYTYFWVVPNTSGLVRVTVSFSLSCSGDQKLISCFLFLFVSLWFGVSLCLVSLDHCTLLALWITF